eukprot:s386_g8.t1
MGANGGRIQEEACDAASAEEIQSAPSEQPVNHDITDEFRSRLHSSIADAQFSCSRPPEIVMPWEMPALSWVFGSSETPVVPDVPPIWQYVETPATDTESHPVSALVVKDTPTIFENAISFNSFKTCFLNEKDQLSMPAQRWESLISICYASFDLGIQICDDTYPNRVRAVSEILAGKSPATLSRRLSQITRYVKWASEAAKRPPFPVTSELVKNYVRHLRNLDSSHSAFRGFQEVLTFIKHVIGLDCDLSAFDSAWIAGVMRAAQQSRPLQKQSTTLNVKTLQFLEQFLQDQGRSLVDRYAAGVIVFAVYSRARFGDLRRIARIILDEADGGSDGSLGFIEMHSASHKMRATGNRLGAHLPLIAPIKGLTQGAWGKDFVDVAKKAHLNLEHWVSDMPLLPAPTQVGDWTDRPVTSREVGKWIHGILRQCHDFTAEGFTLHGCKATTLIMLSRYGASPEDRLVLGHHQLHKGALEVYSRDLQSAPLRVLEKMLEDIRKGRFSPDTTRSGMFTPVPEVAGASCPYTPSLSPAPTTPLDDTSGNAMFDLQMASALPDAPAEEATTVNEASEESSSSDFDSEESSTEQAFLCGRSLSKEYKPFTAAFFVDAMKCQQCNKGHPEPAEGRAVASAEAVVKRARRQR